MRVRVEVDLRPVQQVSEHIPLAIGMFALFGAFRPMYRDSAVVFFALPLTGLAPVPPGRHDRRGREHLVSFSTTIAPGHYNQTGLAMYELPNMILAWALFLLRPRR